MRSPIHLPTFFITVIITTFFLLIFISLRLKMGVDCDSMKKIHKKKIKKYGRTGDIIVVAYGSKRAKLVKVFTGSMWTHCSILLVEENKPMRVIEVAHYGEDRTGLVITDLEEWLKRHKYCILGYRPYHGSRLNKSRIDTYIEENEGIRADMNVVSWLKTMYKFSYKTTKKKRFYCSEFVVSFLQDMGIMRKKYDASGYKPWELLYGDIPLREKGAYTYSYLIKDYKDEYADDDE